jgi:rod shape determining protein RodA
LSSLSLSLVARPRGLDRVTETPSRWRRVDLVLVGVTFALALAGLLMVYSATRASSGGAAIAIRQCVWMALGTVIMLAVAFVDYRRIRNLVPWAYGITVFLLLFVLSPLGSSSKGAQAWFAFGAFQFQPSEFAKLVVIVSLSAYASRQLSVLHRSGLDNRHAAVMVGIAAIPMGLILLQNDLGTALVFAVVTFTLLVVAGAPGRAIGGLVMATLVIAFAVVQFGVLKQYQVDRLTSFVKPTANEQQATYNLNQSQIAIGSGALTGKGLFLGTQTNLRYVPEQHTDFIFTVVGEELGLLGGGTLLALFALLIWRMLQAAREASDAFGSYICAGVAGMFTFQIFENVGMTMGIMPITGIPLPFLSYGGSSTLACFAAVGLILNVRFRGNG